MTAWRRIPFVLLLLAMFAAGAPSPAMAQDSTDPTAEQQAQNGQIVESWTLAPAGSDDPSQPGNRPNLTYSAAAGSSIQDAVTVYNYSNVPLTFRIYASDAFNTEDGSFDILSGDKTPVDVGSWVKLAQNDITLPPGLQATIPITIDVPADASPGDHVGAIVAASRAEGTGADGKVIALERRTGTRLYLRVDGPIEQNLSVEDVSPKYDPSLNPISGDATVSYTVVNRGNVRLSGEHYVTMSGPFGLMEVKSQPLTLPELLPGASVTFTQTLTRVPAGILDSTTVHLDPAGIEGEQDPLGPQSTSALTLALPWTVLALALVALLVWFAWRRFRHHGDAKPPKLPSAGGSGRPSGSSSMPQSRETQSA